MPLPDAAALVRVDHGRRRIEIVHVRQDYGGYNESDQWAEITEVARQILRRTR